MTVPSIEITNQGIIAPSTQEVKNGLWQMFLQAFGTDLNQSEDTPQGQLVVSLTAMVQDERDKMIQLMNQIDPQYSTGIWQDAIEISRSQKPHKPTSPTTGSRTTAFLPPCTRK